ncbi:MAG: hypothetical protein LUG98_00080 [Tannerellaceae bacterium]|nr:hypothetical protein [Tannerellaceae bacterium]
MEKKQISYEKLIDTFRKHPPIPEGPDAITAGIMEKIAGLPQKKEKKKSRSAALPGMAAAILLGFLFHELWLVETVPSLPDPFRSITSISGHQPVTCIETEGNKDVQDRINCFLKEQQQQRYRKEALFMNLIK